MKRLTKPKTAPVKNKVSYPLAKVTPEIIWLTIHNEATLIKKDLSKDFILFNGSK